MGLDQYLRAKTTKREYKGATGACSGIFNVAPEDNGMVELGYWRKAYDQSEVIIENAIENVGDCTYRIDREGCKRIIDTAKNILSTHKFDEDGYDEDSFMGTFCSNYKWEDTIKFFEDALSLFDEDSEMELYYLEWF